MITMEDQNMIMCLEKFYDVGHRPGGLEETPGTVFPLHHPFIPLL